MSNIQEELLRVQERINPYIRRTPILANAAINQSLNAEVFFKCENLQFTGSFKMRGAANAVFSLKEDERVKGVTCHSSGNFAQAVARSARLAECPAYIVMPHNAPQIKRKGVLEQGGEITLCEPTLDAREKACATKVEEWGCASLHPSNQWEVILGQGTAIMELLEDHPDLDVVITPVGGGGLLAGAALAAIHFGKPNIEVSAGEPALADDAFRSFHSGQIEKNDRFDTIADGLRTHLGDVNFPIIRKHVKGIVRVEEEDIISAMKELYNRLKVVIEPSCAVPFAALKNTPTFAGKKIGVILSGGNVDLERLGSLFG